MRLREQPTLTKLLLDFLEMLLTEYEGETIKQLLKKEKYFESILSKLQYVESNEIYKRAYWLLTDHYSDKQTDIFSFTGTESFML